jgi:hypothetical protein
MFATDSFSNSKNTSGLSPQLIESIDYRYARIALDPSDRSLSSFSARFRRMH